MKTLEFKLAPTGAQVRTLTAWLETEQRVWNRAVFLLQNFRKFNPYDKLHKQSYPASPIASENRRLWNARVLWADEAEIESSLLCREITSNAGKEVEVYKINGDSVYPWRSGEYPSCPIGWIVNDGLNITHNPKTKKTAYPTRLFGDAPAIDNISFISLCGVFAKKHHRDPFYLETPTCFHRGTLLMVFNSWQAFLRGDGKPPKFKRKHDRVNTLINSDSKNLKIEGNRIQIPGLGMLRVQGLAKRWPQGLAFCPLKICRKSTGWYLQLTGDLPTRKQPKMTGKIAGLNCGIKRVYTDDAGRFVEPPRYLEKNARALARLQRKYSRSFELNAKVVLGRKRWGADGPTKNAQKIQRRIARLHEKIARSRRAFNHWQSTKLVRQFDAIALDDINLKQILLRPEPRPNPDGNGFEPNGAKEKSWLNRGLLDNGIGSLFALTESKAQSAGKKAVRISAHFESCRCPRCNSIKPENRPTWSDPFRCVDCGYFDPDSDRNHAANLKESMVSGRKQPVPKGSKRKG